MKTVEEMMNKYRRGEVSLFEASKKVDMYPQEFMNFMMEFKR